MPQTGRTRGLNHFRQPLPAIQEKEPSMASNEEILSGLAEIVNEETGLAPEAVELDKSFTEDLDIDSISMMTIVVNAEEKFGVRIPDEEVKNLKTVGDAVSFIAGAQA
jgi:acyl carrier protein